MQYELFGNGDRGGEDRPDAEPAGEAEPYPRACGGPGLLTGRRWASAAPDVSARLPALRRELPLAAPVSDWLLALLAERGLTEAAALERFFFPSLTHLHDPFLLAEMDAAVGRVLAAARAGERVAVHGDFDVDGMTGCVLLSELLRGLVVDGHRVDLQAPFVPDRVTDGYGVCARQVRAWGAAGVTLLVTVDTGAAAHEEIALARSLGMDTVVLDHHLFPSRPAAGAMVNPRRTGCRYPNRDLCGVAVAYKLAQALQDAAPGCFPPELLEETLDLVALGLVADQMPLVGENRTLVLKGLLRLRGTPSRRPGVAALLDVAGFDRGFPVTAANLAYQVAPRLNACGRIGRERTRVGTALNLLLTTDAGAARELARQADEANRERQRMDQAAREDAIAMAGPYLARGDPGLVLASPHWHKGIIGIVASRLVELYDVPAILIALEGGAVEARGSARSVPRVDIKAVLDRCAPLLLRHGGHAQAAGMTVRACDIAPFREAFLAVLRAAPPAEAPIERYDLDLPLAGMTAGQVGALVAELEQLEPFGHGHREPVFRCDGLRLFGEPRAVGSGGHLRFAFRGPKAPPGGGGSALMREFVAFGCADAWNAARAAARGDWPGGRRWDILFKLSRSHYRPRSGAVADPVQQQLIDLRPSDSP